MNAFCNRHHQLLWNFIETIPCNFCSLSLDVSEKAFPSSLARLPPSPQLHNRGCLEERQTRTHSSLIYYSLLVMTSGKMPIKFAVFFLHSYMQPSLNKHFPSEREQEKRLGTIQGEMGRVLLVSCHFKIIFTQKRFVANRCWNVVLYTYLAWNIIQAKCK